MTVQVSPLDVAWERLGGSARPGDGGWLPGFECASCGRDGLDTTPGAAVLPKAFGTWDDFVSVANPRLCGPCVWAWTGERLRSYPVVVRRSTRVAEFCDDAAVHEVLRAGALSDDVALIVPVQTMRRHVAPRAAWGRVATNTLVLTWTDVDAQRLRAVARLRESGCGSSALGGSAFPFRVLAAAAPQARESLLEDWDTFKAWDTRTAWIDLAVKITISVSTDRKQGASS